MDATSIAATHSQPSSIDGRNTRLRRCSAGLLLYLLWSTAAPAAAQDSGVTWWKPTTWMSGGSDKPAKSFPSGSSGDNSLFSMPNMSWTSSDQPTAKEPSMLGRMGQSTKKAWNSTVDFLNPFDSKTSSSSSSSRSQSYQSQSKTTKSGSGMFGWLWREETIETPTSVNEFLRNERPRF